MTTLNVVFLHPDLGIGGAERAIVDAAMALKSSGHHVTMLTAHHDTSHCFEETRDGRLDVIAVGDWLPSEIPCDLVFCDQISACIPVLRCSRQRLKVIFYCHFPDMLLTDRRHVLKKLYRAPIDWLEELTTGMADCILVNSRFTAEVFHDAFHSLSDVTPEVLYPVPDCLSADQQLERHSVVRADAHSLFLSINRYERKKNVELALEALAALSEMVDEEEFAGVELVIAGGYDELVSENCQYLEELQKLASQLNISSHVTFLCNVSTEEKQSLLLTSTCLVYTPDKEHFGIVPVEAMHARCPVIAVNSGGPRETVVDGVTGFLCSPSATEFADAMNKFVGEKGRAIRQQMGDAGHERAQQCFSFESFAVRLCHIVHLVCTSSTQ